MFFNETKLKIDFRYKTIRKIQSNGRNASLPLGLGRFGSHIRERVYGDTRQKLLPLICIQNE